MASYSELVTLIKADNSDFNKKINDSQSKAASFAKSLAKVGAVAATAIGVTAVAGFAILLKVINDTTDEVSALVDTANRLGGSVGGLQKLQYAVGLSGVSAEQLNSAMTKLARSVLTAKNEASGAAKALKDLGLTQADLANLSIDEQYIRVAEALGKIPSKAKQTELAFALFGKSGISQLSAIRDGISQNITEFEKLGGVLTDQQASAIDSYGDSVDKLKATFSAFAVQLTAAVAPALVEFLKYVQESIIAAGGLGVVGKEFGLFIVDGIIAAVNAFQALLDGLQSIKVGYLEAKLAAMNFLETLKEIQFATTGTGDIFSGQVGLRDLEKQIAAARDQNTDVTTGLLMGLDNARNVAATGQSIQKIDVSVSPSKDFMVTVSQSAIVKQALEAAVYYATGSEAGATTAQ